MTTEVARFCAKAVRADSRARKTCQTQGGPVSISYRNEDNEPEPPPPTKPPCGFMMFAKGKAVTCGLSVGHGGPHGGRDSAGQMRQWYGGEKP